MYAEKSIKGGGVSNVPCFSPPNLAHRKTTFTRPTIALIIPPIVPCPARLAATPDRLGAAPAQPPASLALLVVAPTRSATSARPLVLSLLAP
jgi:hypothetical protein